MIKIAPSILSADFSRLGEEVRKVEGAGADWIHIDVMDGNFVPNITIGPAVVRAIRKHCSIPFDVHLMILRPERYLDRFSEAGADYITLHVEATERPADVIREIHRLGKKAGISLNPGTPFSEVRPYMDKIDLLLIMTVNPGFGGQSFMYDVVPKIREASEYKERTGLEVEIAVDGGINAETARVAISAGATVLVAGSSLFSADSMADEIKRWRQIKI